MSLWTWFAIRAEMFQWGLRKTVFDRLETPLFMGRKILSGDYWQLLIPTDDGKRFGTDRFKGWGDQEGLILVAE